MTQQMLYSCNRILDSTITTFYILDTGLTPHQVNVLTTHFKFFDIKIITYPEELCKPQTLITYSFKCWLIDYVYKLCGEEVYMWLDAKQMLKYRQNEIEDMLERCAVWGTTLFKSEIIESVKETDWTHPTCIKRMGLTTEMVKDKKQIQSNGFIMDLRTPIGKEFFEEYKKYSFDKETIAPQGSFKHMHISIETHRQDQSVLSVLMHKYGFSDNHCLFSTFHNTIFD